MSIIESKFNGYPKVTDWDKVYFLLQQANSQGFNSATKKEIVQQLFGDVAIQGADYEDLPISTSSAVVPLPIPEADLKYGFLSNGTYSQANGPNLVYTETQWGLTLFTDGKWSKKFTLEMPKVALSERINQWVLAESYTIQSYTETQNGISTAAITFPDGQAGNITSITYDSSGRISTMIFSYNSNPIINKTLTITYNNNQVQTSIS